jgi:perosamine synthetase
MTRTFGDLERQYINEVLDSGQLGYVKGGMITRFEEAFARKIGARYGSARNSAMTALAMAVSFSEAGPGFEVICDPIVHFGGVAALYYNAIPRFADVNPDTYLMTPDSVRANITDRTKALIVTNLWGLCAELDEIRKICDEHGIFMIEDCAHNIGSFWKGKHAGTYGDFGCFSFQQTKHLSTGDGGMMVTSSDDLASKIPYYFYLGESPKWMYMNYRMNELTAAVGLAQMQHLDSYIEEYTQSLHVYDEAIRDCKWLRNRTVPQEAVQSGYIWACTWEGDKHGLEYARFKKVAKDLSLPLNFGFLERPAYTFDLFKGSTAYHVPDCPVRCPLYKGDYQYHDGLCPNAEELIPRFVTSGLIEVPPDEIKRRTDLLRKAIQVTEQG